MRRILAVTLASIPALFSAQASTVQPSHAPAMLLAKISSAPSAPVLPVVAHGAPMNLVIHQATDVNVDTIRAIARGPVSQSVNVATAPQLVKAVKTELTPQQIAAGMSVRVRLTVDALGMPQDVAVVSATNDDLAKRTVAAVNQYRFKPATVDKVAVATTISLDINIHQ